ncbi:MAG: 50S ribosomal protein L21 [Chloroflexi bacterium]|nr:MAG: 50S ribosomal protein L21 [Chloroflexota bacterium]
MPKPDSSPSAVIVSGGKQYRVAPGDRILVDRLTAEPGSSVKLGRVLIFSDGKDVKVGAPTVDGLDVDAKVIAHRRGPRIESIRYKSKKRVRVHSGGRAHLTALEIIAVGGVGLETEEKEEEAAPAGKRRGRAKAASAGRAQGKSDKKRAAAPKAEAATEGPAAEAKEEAPTARVREASEKETTRRRKKETE